MAKAATRAEFPFIIWKENLKEASSSVPFPVPLGSQIRILHERPTISLSATSRTQPLLS